MRQVEVPQPAGRTCCTGPQRSTRSWTGGREGRLESAGTPGEVKQREKRSRFQLSAASADLRAPSTQASRSLSSLRVLDQHRSPGSTTHSRLTFHSAHRRQHPEEPQEHRQQPGSLAGGARHLHGEAVRRQLRGSGGGFIQRSSSLSSSSSAAPASSSSLPSSFSSSSSAAAAEG